MFCRSTLAPRHGPDLCGSNPARLHVSLIPLVQADAPNVVWAIDFQFDSTVDGKAIKIASMIDEHTWVSRATERRPNTPHTRHPVACELKALRCVCSRAADTGTANRGCWRPSNAKIEFYRLWRERHADAQGTTS